MSPQPIKQSQILRIREIRMLETLLKIYSFISQIWSSLPQEKKDEICLKFVELMDEVFRRFFRANGGTAQ
jgi:hypothetical protein